MRKFSRPLLFSFIFLSFASCSMMIDDLKNCSKGSKYVVEHYQEITAEYKKTPSGYEQINLATDDKGNPVPKYTLFETETFRGEPDSLTAVTAKNYKGFTAQSFEQKKIEANDSCVIKIFYNRKDITITVCIGDGIWNYNQKKTDESIEEDKENRSFTKKYGSLTSSDFEDLLTSSGKKGFVLTKFNLSDGKEASSLPDVFPAEDVTYTAIWEEGKPANYKVLHHFEKLDCLDSSIESDENYEIKVDLTNTKTGIPETETETQDCVASVPGFTAKNHSEQEIAANGSTVINIFYVRNPYSINISTDDGLWNYDAWKSNKSTVSQDTSTKNVNGKYESLIDWSFLNSLKKTGMNLTGLKNNDTGEVVKRDNLPKTIPSSTLNYTAAWSKKSPVSYEIKFMTENVNSANSDDTKNYSLHSSDTTKTGTPEYFTEAVSKEIAGFTPKEITQEEIKEDGSTAVYVYYVRNNYKITFDLNGGYWNYVDYRDNKTLTPDSAAKEISGKFEESVLFPDFNKIGKRANDFSCWKNLATSRTYKTEELVEDFEKFVSTDVVLQAQWTKGSGYEYKVRHWFEKIDSKDSSNTSNYTLKNDLTQTELGEEIGDKTEAVAKFVDGFTAKTFEQKTIEAGGTTVVDIYYTRNSSKFIFDANGGAISGQSEISGKFDSVFDSSSTPTATKSGWTFGGWTFNGKLVSNSDLQIENQKFGIEDKTFQAYWISTVSVKTVTTFGDIVLTKAQDSNQVTCSIKLPTGYEDKNWTYKWYVDGVYRSDETVFSRALSVLGKGVHTITVKATMNGQNFTQRVTATID